MLSMQRSALHLRTCRVLPQQSGIDFSALCADNFLDYKYTDVDVQPYHPEKNYSRFDCVNGLDQPHMAWETSRELKISIHYMRIYNALISNNEAPLPNTKVNRK